MSKPLVAKKARIRREIVPLPGVTPYMIRYAAAGMLPLYRTVAENAAFARRWSKAVVRADLADMQKLLKQAKAEKAARQGLGSNGIGYYVSFGIGRRDSRVYYTNGTTIPPGTVQFIFEPKIHREMARAVLPLYRELADKKRNLAESLTRAIRLNQTQTVKRIVRKRIHSAALRSIEIADGGISLNFKFSASKFIYRNMFFVEAE